MEIIKSNPMKTIEQQRGKILSDKLILLNEFISEHEKSGLTFSEFLITKMSSLEKFLYGLPKPLRDASMGIERSDSKKLFDYAIKMNDEYTNQYVLFQKKKMASANGGDCNNCDGSCNCDCPFKSEPRQLSSDGEYMNASAGVITKCNLRYPPPRASARRKKQYQDCLVAEQKIADDKKTPPAGTTCGIGEKWKKRRKRF